MFAGVLRAAASEVTTAAKRYLDIGELFQVFSVSTKTKKSPLCGHNTQVLSCHRIYLADAFVYFWTVPYTLNAARSK